MLKLVLISLIIFSSFVHSKEFNLRVLSYNIEGTPRPLSKNHWRFREIAKDLKRRKDLGKAPHIVLIQEAFIIRSKRINKITKYPYQLIGPKRNPFKRKIFNSGLRILSEYPIEKVTNITFGSSCSGADCFANKGAQITRVSVPGLPFKINLLNTHMQARPQYDSDRLSQIDQLRETTTEQVNSLTEPFFIIGDLNIKPDRESFHYFRDSFSKMSHSGEECLSSSVCKIDPTTPKNELVERTNDHHFYYTPKHISVSPTYVSRNFREKLRGVHLSDHFGYEVHYRIKYD